MKIYSFVLGFLLCSILSASILLSSTLTQINVSFDPIKILINGEEKIPEEDMKPFIYNGRTYVSLRFIGESFGNDVSWDNKGKVAEIKHAIKNTPSPTVVPMFTKVPNEGGQNVNEIVEKDDEVLETEELIWEKNFIMTSSYDVYFKINNVSYQIHPTFEPALFFINNELCLGYHIAYILAIYNNEYETIENNKITIGEFDSKYVSMLIDLKEDFIIYKDSAKHFPLIKTLEYFGIDNVNYEIDNENRNLTFIIS
jgi:hypothetical protein